MRARTPVLSFTMRGLPVAVSWEWTGCGLCGQTPVLRGSRPASWWDGMTQLLCVATVSGAHIDCKSKIHSTIGDTVRHDLSGNHDFPQRSERVSRSPIEWSQNTTHGWRSRPGCAAEGGSWAVLTSTGSSKWTCSAWSRRVPGHICWWCIRCTCITMTQQDDARFIIMMNGAS